MTAQSARESGVIAQDFAAFKCSFIVIDGTRLTEERAKAARGCDAPALAGLAAVLAFGLVCGLLAIATGV